MTPLELRVLSGARSGEVLRVRGDRVTVGRGPEASVRFDPGQDLEVSALHAELLRRGHDWYVRDLGSRNGTWLDGGRVEGESLLRTGSRVRFGPTGPEVEVGLGGELGGAAPPPATTSHASGAPGPAGASGGEAGRSPTTPSARIRALSRRNRTLAQALAGVLLVVVVAGLGLAWAWTSRDAAFQQERAVLRSDMDSLLEASRRTIEQLQGEMAGMAGILRDSQGQVQQLRSALEAAERGGGDEAEIDDLRRRLQAATVALTRHQLAASLDFDAIAEANRAAVAVVYVELEPGRVSTGTAFAVRPDGTLVTNRHVVRGEDGTSAPLRIGVQFTDSPQVWPGRVVRVAPDDDVALLRVDRIVGDVPTVAGFNREADTLAVGSPVAVLGFPLGGEGPDRTSGRAVPRALMSAGVLQARSPGRLEVVGYGEQGASGSPVLDADGRVVGVLFGGRDDDGTRILLAVPAAAVVRFLEGGG